MRHRGDPQGPDSTDYSQRATLGEGLASQGATPPPGGLSSSWVELCPLKRHGPVLTSGTRDFIWVFIDAIQFQ